MAVATPTRPAEPRLGLLTGIAAGSAMSVVLGVYGAAHDNGSWGFTAFFSSMGAFKSWMATAVLLFAVVQVASALRLYGRISVPANEPAWLGDIHRLSGTLALLFSLPVAFHCLYVAGFNGGQENLRTLVHSIVGCFAYGAFVAKVTFVRLRGLPSWVLPVAGGATFCAFTILWLTSSLWYFGWSGGPVF